ncbi:MAG TPA: hypothetical protein VFW14_14340 [Gaiellales bacterium]|jgi:hypothetical protein|nr:hypothetical protein [Gaiellales bacterium]
MDRQAENERLGLEPTADAGTRLSADAAWDESTRPHREAADAGVEYSRRRGRLVGRHLIDVHDTAARPGSAARRARRGA